MDHPRDATFRYGKEVSFKTHVLCDTCYGSILPAGYFSRPARCAQGSAVLDPGTLFARMQTQAPCPTCQGFGTILPGVQRRGSCSDAPHSEHQAFPAGASEGAQIRVSGWARSVRAAPTERTCTCPSAKKHPF